ncbi:ImmA/IrrE family metallo-endopeptidase [Corynebacterium nuruki]|uniref:ImmA/IrrE family metallo-endopeptidase n=1 Tax=Corynebacterium nuruki TaxID=1032851 RepID=UPI0039BF5E31
MTTATGLRPDPEQWAEEHQITVDEHAGGEKGQRLPDGSITIRSDLGPINRRCTLAHELGHHVHGDAPTPDRHTYSRQERRAWEWAATFLIDAETYRQAELTVGCHPGALAAELGVTVHLIKVWRTMTRKRETTTP